MLQIKKDLFRCGEGRMVFSVRECENASDLSELIEKGGGLAIRSDDFSYDGDGGPFTINLVNSSGINKCSSREAFSSEFIFMCCLKNIILPLKNYWLKRSNRFHADFDPQDVLFQEISWLDAESLFSANQYDEHAKCAASVEELNRTRPIVKQEGTIQRRARTPPLFSEDEVSQETPGIISINGLVPVIKLIRCDDSEQCPQLSRKTKPPVWPQNFFAEFIEFVQKNSSQSSNSPSQELDVPLSNKNLNAMVKKSKNKRQRLEDETETSSRGSSSSGNLRLQFDDSPSEREEVAFVTDSLEVRSISIQCGFEEPLCEDIAVQTMPTKVIPFNCVPTGFLLCPQSRNTCKAAVSGHQIVSDPKNSSDFICQTDFVEPVLCDQACQTMDVVVQPFPVEGCIVYLKDIESRNFVGSSLAENEKTFTSNHCGHQSSNYAPDSSDSEGQLLKQHSKSSFDGNESHTRENGPLTPENEVSSIDSCVKVSPNKDSLQVLSPRSSRKKKLDLSKLSSPERGTRSSQRKVTRLSVASHRKTYSERKK